MNAVLLFDSCCYVQTAWSALVSLFTFCLQLALWPVQLRRTLFLALSFDCYPVDLVDIRFCWFIDSDRKFRVEFGDFEPAFQSGCEMRSCDLELVPSLIRSSSAKVPCLTKWAIPLRKCVLDRTV